MEFTVGDKVILRLKNVKDLNSQKISHESPGLNSPMGEFFNKIVTLSLCQKDNPTGWKIEEDGNRWCYRNSWFEKALVNKKIKLKDLV